MSPERPASPAARGRRTPTVELPDGRVVDVPVCPTCAASGLRCVRPSGHTADRWHDARERALATLCRCEQVCARWLDDDGAR